MTSDELAAILAGDTPHIPAWARFDAPFYRATNPTLGIPPGAAARDVLLRHYLHVGRFGARSPNPWFDEAWYLARHPEIGHLVAAGRHGIESGFEHFLLLGHAFLSPHWLFDAALYREQVSDHALAFAGHTDLYDHYLRSGARRALPAHAMFEPEFYLAANAVPADAVPREGAYGHYLTRLWRDGAEGWTAPRFDLVTVRRAALGPIAEGTARGALHHALSCNTASSRDGMACFPPATARALRAAAVAGIPSEGGIDAIGAHQAAGGWFVAGWLGRAGTPGDAPVLHTGADAVVALHHEDGTVAASSAIGLFARDDLAGSGDGFLAFVPSTEGVAAGPVRRVDVVTEGSTWHLAMPPELLPIAAADLPAALEPIAAQLSPSEPATAIRARLAHRVPDSANTLAQLPERVFLEIDEAMALPNGDLVLAGWHLARPGAVRAIRLRHGWRTRAIHLDEAIAIERPDVRDAVGREAGLMNLRCGFLLRVPGALDPAGTGGTGPYIEIELESGAIGQRAVSLGSRAGLDAIRFILDRADSRFGDAAPSFDRTLGPAIASLQAARIAEAGHVRRLDFGTAPPAPRVSVVATLYGRVDFMDFQLGIAAAQQIRGHFGTETIERLYVLDDPPRARATETLAAQAHLRFALPFSLLMPDENRGFAGANNIGLAASRGTYVCFLNSDVFPGTPDWIERLAARLDADPTLGAVAPRLLYEDGSIQHDGMEFRRVPRVGAWRFPDHPGKGMRPRGGGLHGVPAATGACLMMRRDLAAALGGFDEAYPVGDFEDADLCLKLSAMGLAIAVDRDTVLFHLERQSQAGSAEHWRMQLTLFNAWQHERRWHRLLDRAECA